MCFKMSAGDARSKWRPSLVTARTFRVSAEARNGRFNERAGEVERRGVESRIADFGFTQNSWTWRSSPRGSVARPESLDIPLGFIDRTPRPTACLRGNMSAPKLTQFPPEELKRELLARGAAAHARIASEMIEAQQDLGGNADLADFSSQELARALRDTQRVIYGVDDRKDLFDV